jgi:hypothetical protein
LLHTRLEKIWAEREILCKRLLEKEHENHQLMSFVLMEGLQVPELLPPTPSMFDAVAAAYPAGNSTFKDDVALMQCLGVHGEGRRDDGEYSGSDEDYSENAESYDGY